MAYNDDAREASSVTGRALATAAIAVVGVGTAGVGLHFGKKAVNKATEVVGELAGGVKKNGLLSEIGERMSGGQGSKIVEQMDEHVALERDMSKARAKFEKEKAVEKRKQYKEDLILKNKQAEEAKRAEAEEMRGYQEEIKREQAKKQAEMEAQKVQANINSAKTKENNAFKPTPNVKEEVDSYVRNSRKVIGENGNNSEIAEQLKDWGKPKSIQGSKPKVVGAKGSIVTSQVSPRDIVPMSSIGGASVYADRLPFPT